MEVGQISFNHHLFAMPWSLADVPWVVKTWNINWSFSPFSSKFSFGLSPSKLVARNCIVCASRCHLEWEEKTIDWSQRNMKKEELAKGGKMMQVVLRKLWPIYGSICSIKVEHKPHGYKVIFIFISFINNQVSQGSVSLVFSTRNVESYLKTLTNLRQKNRLMNSFNCPGSMELYWLCIHEASLI